MCSVATASSTLGYRASVKSKESSFAQRTYELEGRLYWCHPLDKHVHMLFSGTPVHTPVWKGDYWRHSEVKYHPADTVKSSLSGWPVFLD